MKTNRFLSVMALSLSVLGGTLGPAGAAPASKEFYSDAVKRAEHHERFSRPNESGRTWVPIYRMIHN